MFGCSTPKLTWRKLTSSANSTKKLTFLQKVPIREQTTPSLIQTFCLPGYALHDGKQWIEGSVEEEIEKRRKETDEDLPPVTCQEIQDLGRSQYPPPAYPYLHSIHTYSALVQAHIRSHTLPTSAALVEHLAFQTRPRLVTLAGIDGRTSTTFLRFVLRMKS